MRAWLGGALLFCIFGYAQSLNINPASTEIPSDDDDDEVNSFWFASPGRRYRLAHVPPTPPCEISWKAPYYKRGPYGGGSQAFLERKGRGAVQPFSDAKLAAFSTSSGSFARLALLMRKMAMGEPVTIVVLGGSVTAGRDCGQLMPDGHQAIHKECSWPKRLHAGLLEIFPKSDITLLNMAISGTGTAVSLSGIGLLLQSNNLGSIVDLIIVDTLVNDAYQLQPTESDRKLMEKYTTAQYVSLAYEDLVRALHSLAPKSEVMSFLPACPSCFGDVRDAHINVARHYDLPLVDYGALVKEYPAGYTYKRDNILWSNDTLHPRATTHQLMADVILNAWGKAYFAACEEKSSLTPTRFPTQTLSSQRDLEQIPVCLKPTSAYSAERASAMEPDIDHGWRLFEDRPHKPGWISEENNGTMRFKLKFGKTPRLAITFLKSYEGMGQASVYVTDRHGRERNPVVLDGLWDPNLHQTVSVYVTQWFQVETGATQAHRFGVDAGLQGWGVEPESERTLVVTAVAGKFKIIEVAAC